MLQSIAVLTGFLLAPGQAPPVATSPQERVTALLVGSPAGSQDEQAALSAALAALGVEALPAMLDALRDQAVRSGPRGPSTALAPAAAEAVHGALARLGRNSVVGALRERVVEDAAPPERALAVEVLGRIGTASELELLVEAAGLSEGQGGPEPRLVRALERALVDLLRREPSRVRTARRLLVTAEPHVLPPLARAIAASGSPDAFEVLADSLGASAELDLALLPCLADASGRDPAQPLDARLLDALHARLADADTMLRRTAVLAAGGLEDAASVEPLIALLDSSDRPLSEAAHWSLRRITGLRFAAEPERWESWYADEERWFRARFPLCKRALDSRPDAILAALQEIGRHRLERRALVAAVVEVSAHGDPAVRAMACAVLGQLGSGTAAGVLRERTQDDEPLVARRAEEGLRSLAASGTPFGLGHRSATRSP